MRCANLYDRLERALIALEYALADARSSDRCPFDDAIGDFAKSQDALQLAGEDVQEVLLALRAAALQEAALRVRQWN